jgi:3-oxoadipate enol-lactonase/4-carboxymuconolactone decarboxylase
MTRPELAGSWLTSATANRPLLVVGPSLGTSVESLWSACAGELRDRFSVLAWDLPGHGRSKAATGSFSVADLAAAVMGLVESALSERGEPGGTFRYAGDSIGGAVGLQLLLDWPGRVAAATVLCAGARIGTPSGWQERADLVREAGTAALAESAPGRWFAPGFVDRHPDRVTALVSDLQRTDAASYALICEALASFDVTSRLAEIAPPVLAVAGRHDEAVPVASLREIASGVRDGRLVVLDDVAHQAPAEAPEAVARLIAAHGGTSRVHEIEAAGTAVRRAVLGDAHVDRADAATTDFTRDFQQLITRYAWGTIWTRPGLDRRSRSLVTLTALVALGSQEELAMHVRAARTNGLSTDEIKEVLLQTAVYCGVPTANTAFRVAQRVLDELDATGGPT